MKAVRTAGIVLAGLILGAPGADAATLGDVAAALAAPAGAPHAANDWSAFSKLKGAQWQGNAPNRKTGG